MIEIPSRSASPARIRVTRGGLVESEHRVHAVVVTRGDDGGTPADGAALLHWGEVDRTVFLRSTAKPWQALPLVEDGVLERFGWGPAELVLACASHNGEPEHVELSARMLESLGLESGALACGAHPPLDPKVAEARTRAGDRFGPLDSNCSGKHVGMLALALAHGWPTEGYHRPEHPVQRRMATEVARWAKCEPEALVTGTDGCGVVCFGVPLAVAAEGLARFARAARDPGSGPGRICGAVRERPELLGGVRRLCSEVVPATGGRIFAKIGAEAVYGAWIPDDGTGRSAGVAVKVEDGGRRAVETALVGVLESAGLLRDDELPAFSRTRRPTVRNTRGEPVGEIVFVPPTAGSA